MANTSFSDLKKNRQDTVAKLNEEIERMSSKGTERSEDTKFWKPTEDQIGNGSAIIRFLPPPPGEDLPFVRLFSHGFKGPTNSWYFENSLTTLGQPDPVSDYNVELWNAGSEEKKNQARRQKRRLDFIANIYVVKDPGDPSNDGKVMLYKFGKKIFDKIQEAMHPEFEDEEAFNPFDLWEGANFRIKFKKEGGFRQYDNSFGPRAPLLKKDADMEAVWKQQHSLQQFLDPSNFKSYDVLKARLNAVLGVGRDLPQQEAAPLKQQESSAKTFDNAGDDEEQDAEFDALFNKLKTD